MDDVQEKELVAGFLQAIEGDRSCAFAVVDRIKKRPEGLARYTALGEVFHSANNALFLVQLLEDTGSGLGTVLPSLEAFSERCKGWEDEIAENLRPSPYFDSMTRRLAHYISKYNK